MMKSLEKHFSNLTWAIMKDIIAYKPSHQLGLVRDHSRIISLLENMGSRLFTEHLPSIRKQLDVSLSSLSLELQGPLTRPYKTGSHIPRLFRGIWEEIFSFDGKLRSDVDPNFIAFLRQLLDVGNKLELECPPSSVYEEVREFYNNDVTLPPASRFWDDGDYDNGHIFDKSVRDRVSTPTDQQDLFESCDGADTKLLDTIQRVADMVSSSIGYINPLETGPRHGPGAVFEGYRGIEKFLNNRWSQRLEAMFPYSGFAAPISEPHPEFQGESCSELLAVPKTIKGPRLIAKEPYDHIFCQLGVMDELYKRVHSNPYLSKSIDFRRQDISQELTLQGSRTGKIATIDLKSASDRISCWLVERIFRRHRNLLEIFQSSRTRYISLVMDKKLPSLHKLHKFSTQGSAYTFPVQSIVFAIICVGSVARPDMSSRQIRNLFSMVRVYGDDIIVPVDWLESVKRSLELLYLKVNTTKTHSQGLFRESCGMDAFDGVDVTPAHVNRFIESGSVSGIPSVLAASNNFFTRGFWNAADYLASTVPDKYLRKVPVRSLPDTAIHLRSFHGNWLHPSVLRRWNPDYQVEEVKIFTTSVKHKDREVDGTKRLSAFLTRSAYELRTLFLDGVEPLTFASRWDVAQKSGIRWVGLNQG